MSKKNIKRLDKNPNKKAKAAPAAAPAKKSNKFFGYLLGFVVVFGVISFIALGGGMVMSVFGFEFTSAGNVILFFLAASAISYPLIRLVTQIPRIMCVNGQITKGAAAAMYIALGTAANALAFFVLDMMMDNITATFPAILVISVLFSLFGVKDVDKRPE